jgi:hypothetical protein
LTKATSSSPGKQLLIVIDAINQFDDAYNASSVDWLPDTICPGILVLFLVYLHRVGLSVVVSTLKGTCLDNLNRRQEIYLEIVTIQGKQMKYWLENSAQKREKK